MSHRPTHRTESDVTSKPAPRPLLDFSRFNRLQRLAWASVLLAGATACGGGGGGSPAPAPTPAPAAGPAPAGSLTVTGIATFDSVPTNANGRGLNYAGTTQKPIRGATVQLLSAADAVLATARTDAAGQYSVTLAAAQTVKVRVRAEIKRTGSSSGDRDLTVFDNTAAGGEALYVLDSATFTPAAATTTQNLNAASGWGGSGYTGVRAAAPFAILDVVYVAQAKIATAAPTVTLPPLKLYWSPNNRPVGPFDAASGAITTSFFTGSGSTRALYLLGAENTDTDEYDSHVVAHEFGHYLQSALSRDDSPGGPHGSGDRLDLRVAFSEGWGNAWSGMALGSPIYTDSGGSAQSGGFALDVSTPATGADRGAYSETSGQYLLWTAHQDAAIGFAPIYNALRALATSPTFTTLYSFAVQLKAAVPAAAATVTSTFAAQQIATQDALGTGETNNGGNAANLPVYKPYTVGATQNFCVRTDADSADDGNKLGRYVYIAFTASGSRTITATRNGGTFGSPSDPDLLLVKADGSKVVANLETTPTQALTTTLPAGTHVLALEDYNLTSPSTSCFDLTVN